MCSGVDSRGFAGGGERAGGCRRGRWEWVVRVAGILGEVEVWGEPRAPGQRPGSGGESGSQGRWRQTLAVREFVSGSVAGARAALVASQSASSRRRAWAAVRWMCGRVDDRSDASDS